MSGHLQNYRDNDINLHQLDSNYTLLLQIYHHSFFYAVVHQHRLIALAVDCDLKELNDPGEAHDLLTYDYKNIVAGLPATGFTLVPNPLFSTEHITGFARFLDVKSEEKVFAQPLDDENHIIYKVGEAVADTAEIFGLQKAVFMAKGWIAAIANYNPSEKNLYLDINKKQLDVLYFADGKLRFYNTFEFHNPDELAYFASYVSQELGLQSSKTSLILSGDIEAGDKNTTRLAEFFNRVEMNSLHILDLPPQIAPHQILSLAALTLCVSSEVY
jgi:hypothetical protein